MSIKGYVLLVLLVFSHKADAINDHFKSFLQPKTHLIAIGNAEDSLKPPLIQKSDFGFSGSAGIYSSLYTTNKSNITANPFNYGLSLASTLKFKKYTFPFSLSYNSNKINVSYPFVRLGCAPTYKWAKIYLGNQTINYNRYVFGGMNMFGIGFEIHPGWFYLSAITGTIAPKLFIDSTSTSFQSSKPRFETKGYALKAGIKGRKFQFLITYLNGKDNQNSLRYSNPKYKLQPRVNKAIGTEIGFSLTRNITVTSIGGLSILTRDKNASNLDTLLLASNADPLPSWAKILENKPNTTSQIFYAFENSIRYNGDVIGLSIRQRKVMPEFKTLGIRFDANDLVQYTIEPSLNLWGGKFNTNISLGFQKNNLLSKSSVQTNSKIYDLSMSITPNDKLFINTSFSNFGIQTSSTSLASEDSISIRNVNSNIGLTGMYVIERDRNVNKTININLNKQLTTEKYGESKFNNSEFNSLYLNASYNLNNSQGASYNAGLNFNKNNSVLNEFPDQVLDIQSYGFFGGISWKLMNKGIQNKQLTTSVNTNLSLTGLVNGDKKFAYGFGAYITYAFTKKISLNAGYNFSASTIEKIRLIQQSFNTNLLTTF